MCCRILTALFLAVSACQAADTIAVIPLFNLNESTAPDLDWIGESVAEAVHESLSSSGLLVLDREDREEVYRRLSLRTGVVLTKASVIKIGETLDAGAIAFGEFRVDADGGAVTPKSSLRLAVRIIDLKKFRDGAEFSQNGPLENLSQMETKIAWMVARELAPAGTATEEDFLRERPPVRVDAVESYVRGLMAANTDQKTKLFSQAVQLDPRFSQPAFQLGRIQFNKKDYKAAAQSLAKVTKADSHYLESMFLRGLCDYYQNNFDAAADRLKFVADEMPLSEVYNDLGAALSRRNDPAATQNFNKALESDQADPDYWFNAGYSLWKQGMFASAAEKFRAVLERSPEDREARAMIDRCLTSDGPRPGDPGEGRERIKTAFEDSAWRQLRAEFSNK